MNLSKIIYKENGMYFIKKLKLKILINNEYITITQN